MLFSDKPVGDIQYLPQVRFTNRQGDLNDCWAIAAITTVAIDEPEAIRKMFVSDEAAHREGKYKVALYTNYSSEERKIIELDDYFPCRSGIVSPL